MATLLWRIRPDEVYHLAAQSHVRVSFDEPEYTSETTGLGTIRLLEAIRQIGVDCRFYQASSSEMFGSSPPPQNENTPFHPRSPYGTAKVFRYWATRNYREAYGMFMVNGILFNHESPRRGETFVTRKITRGGSANQGRTGSTPVAGQLDAVRDWGYAPEYVEGMWRMMQVDAPEDFVLATGSGHTRCANSSPSPSSSRPRLGGICSIRRTLSAPRRSRFDHRRRVEGQILAGLEAAGAVAGTGEDHGRGRCRAGSSTQGLR